MGTYEIHINHIADLPGKKKVISQVHNNKMVPYLFKFNLND